MNRLRRWIASHLYVLAAKIDVEFMASYPWRQVGFVEVDGKLVYMERIIPPEEIFSA